MLIIIIDSENPVYARTTAPAAVPLLETSLLQNPLKEQQHHQNCPRKTLFKRKPSKLDHMSAVLPFYALFQHLVFYGFSFDAYPVGVDHSHDQYHTDHYPTKHPISAPCWVVLGRV